MARSEVSKFISKVAVMADDCWLWLDALDDLGYGRFRFDSQSPHELAHRVGYRLLRGPIPEGLVLDHLCRRPQCVNPWHMEAVTQRVNILRGESPAAVNAIRERCSEGHLLTARADGRGRVCRPCQARNSRAYRARQRQENER